MIPKPLHKPSALLLVACFVGLMCSTCAMAHKPDPNELGADNFSPGPFVIHGRIRGARFASAGSSARVPIAEAFNTTASSSCPSQLVSCPTGAGIHSPDCCASALPNPSTSCCESDFPVCCSGNPSYCCPSSHPVCLGNVKCGAQIPQPSIPQSRMCICDCAFQFGCMGACSPCDKDCCDRCCQNSYGCDSGNCEATASKHEHVKKLISHSQLIRPVVGQRGFAQGNQDSTDVKSHSTTTSNTPHSRSVHPSVTEGSVAKIKHGKQKATVHPRVSNDDSLEDSKSNGLQLDPSCAPYSSYVQCPPNFGWLNGTVRHHDCCGSEQYFCPTGYGQCAPDDGCCPDGYAIDCGDYCCPSNLPYCLGGMQCSNVGSTLGLNTSPSVGSCPSSRLGEPSETESDLRSNSVSLQSPKIDAGKSSTCVWADKSFSAGACLEVLSEHWRCCASGQWSGPNEGTCPYAC